MATRQYDISIQDAAYQVAESVGSAISEGVSVTIDLATVPSRLDAIKALEHIIQYIQEDVWPPA